MVAVNCAQAIAAFFGTASVVALRAGATGMAGGSATGAPAPSPPSLSEAGARDGSTSGRSAVGPRAALKRVHSLSAPLPPMPGSIRTSRLKASSSRGLITSLM